ncbi:N-ethylmaleimide reductase [Rhodopirellula maiorica SM1]|uniref:N-ethylmaleimide reductase n=1 Tax=Rhodopirellula maiorica SM1 TaxID=1265738 RepID=M5RJU1_9BACT|nr:alkene reductase [Rhodopirellula maiorica]EMI19575.1 N-ethylmaleimide reductase [Rhodopirellula maiorica SM1]
MSTENKLLSTYRLGDLQLSSRVVMAPMTRGRAGQEMTANELMATYYEQRAGAGLVITEGTFPSRMGVGWLHAPGIYTDEMAEAWRPVVHAVHRHETPVFMQLWHTGRTSHSDFLDGKLPIAPSAVRHQGSGTPTPKSDGKEVPRQTPRALETHEVPGVVHEYHQAAERAKGVGFDGIEIHGANGYLVDEFLQSRTNKRDDAYGGSIKKRFQFLKEVIEATLTVFPSNRIGVRLSPNGKFNDMGSEDFREQFLYVAEALDSYDLAYLHLVIGADFGGFHEMGEPMRLSEFRNVYSGTIIANNGFDQESAEQAIGNGEADLVAFARPFISNPDLVNRFANGWPLAEPNQETFYTFDAEGYTDYPAFIPQQELVQRDASGAK